MHVSAGAKMLHESTYCNWQVLILRIDYDRNVNIIYSARLTSSIPLILLVSIVFDVFSFLSGFVVLPPSVISSSLFGWENFASNVDRGICIGLRSYARGVSIN
jgi:hypothetical protein